MAADVADLDTAPVVIRTRTAQGAVSAPNVPREFSMSDSATVPRQPSRESLASGSRPSKRRLAFTPPSGLPGFDDIDWNAVTEPDAGFFEAREIPPAAAQQQQLSQRALAFIGVGAFIATVAVGGSAIAMFALLA